MTCHRETVCSHRSCRARSFLNATAGFLLAGLFLLPGHAIAASAPVSFTGHVPMRDTGQGGHGFESVIVGFTDQVLLPVPQFGGELATSGISLHVASRQGEESIREISWRDSAGEPPAFLAVPLRSAGDTRYRVCARSQQGYKKQCRAYRIVPAPGMKP